MNIQKTTKQFTEYCQYQRGLDSKTIKAYKIDLRQFCEYVSDNDWQDKETIQAYISYVHQIYKPKTAKRKLATLRVFFNYLECEDIIISNPFRKIRIKYKESIILPKVIELRNIEKMLQFAHLLKNAEAGTVSRHICHVRNVALLELLFATGMRISELCNLKIRDIHMIEQYIRIWGKGAKERIISIPNKAVIKSVSDYLKVRSNNSDYLFTNRSNNRLSEQSAINIIAQYAKECDIQQHITPHMFRHSFATYLLDADVDIRYIQHLPGHSSTSITQIYTHISNSKERSILLKKHPRNKLKI